MNERTFSRSGELEAARDAAREAGRLLLDWYRRLGPGDVSFKRERDIVTRADREAEDLIRGRLLAAFPDSGFLGEESGQIAAEGADGGWIVDPLDGTQNFASRIPYFAVSIAHVRAGRPVAAAIHLPFFDEMFTATAGNGCALNGRPVRVSERRDLGASLLATGFACVRDGTPENNLGRFTRVAPRCLSVRRLGSACVDLAYTACGIFDGFWEMELNPWDVAAGGLLVAEAGGRVTDFAGGDGWLNGRRIVATNGRIHQPLLELMEEA